MIKASGFRWLQIMGLILVVSFGVAACATSLPAVEEQPAEVQQEEAAQVEEEAAEAGASEEPGELQQVKVALSAFQDVNSIYVGIENGFYEEEGIELVIQKTDWPGANELLVGGHVDLGTTSDADVTLHNAQGQDTTLAFPLFYFAGGGLMYDPNRFEWQTFDEFMEQTGGDRQEAMRLTLEQAKGTKIGVSAAGAEFATLVGMVDFAGLSMDDYEVVDLAQEELPPALISNSVDIMIAGIPQRLAVLNEGYATLMDQTSLPSTVAHAGFGARREWVDANPELAAKIQKVIYKTLAFIEDNPDESFEIISRHLQEAGTVVEAEDLKGVWNQMEFFISSPEQFEAEVLSPDGRFYWEARFQSVVDNLVETDKIDRPDVPLEDLFYGLKTVGAISEPSAMEEEAAEAEMSEEPGELQQVKVALSAFQDVNSIYVGIENGFYEEEGIELVIQKTDWPGANELLVGGHVDLGTTSDADVTLHNAQGQDTTLAFPLFYFAGGGLMYDPNRFEWQTFDEFMEQTGGDRQEAMRLTLEQAKGTKIGVSAAGAEFATLVGMVDFAGLSMDDYEVIDLAQEELPPALISNSVDVMIAGIPQRLAVLNEGYATLMDQTSLPSTVAHAGFGARREWVDANPELAAKIQKVIYKTLAFIEDNPDESFEIISRHLQEAGTVVDAEDLKGVWNQMEFFISSPEQFEAEVLSPDGRFYWEARFQSVVDNLVETDKIDRPDVPLEDLFYGLKTVEAIQ